MAVRKYHREQVLSILDSFSEAVKEAKKLQQKGQTAAVINLLADIQEAADFLDTFIKERDVDVTKTTTAITALNEGLYYASEDVNGGTAASNTFNHLLKLIYNVQKSAKKELIVNKIEVVFMPYNASMWDSLESVYLSMTADDFCDAYVVPLPWNKLNEHQGIAERCYEGDQFPKDTPITHYNDYDLESRHPEIIFIHNTYDENNLVARVDERFYTRNLKVNCDKLVFIPYYGKLAGDLNHFEHFFHPVLFQNCDLVIVAGEEERKFALEIKKKYKSNAKYEVVALGTPKYDRLFEYEQKAKDGTLEIPDDWREKIYKTEGMKKIVIFYNTSLAAMLAIEEEHPQTPRSELGLKYLAKVESVFEVFKQRDDVVLLWRPHPMMLSAMQSMRPHLVDRWIKIVSAYKKEDYGIYDESSDLHRAIAVSDAYYGDASSVAELHKNAGKKVWHQDVTTPGVGIRSGFCPSFFVAGEALYFKQYFDNNIFRLSGLLSQDAKAECISSIPNKSDTRQRQHIATIVSGDDVYFLPCNDNSIVKFNVKSAEFEQFDLEISHRTFELWGYENNFRNGIWYKNKLFLLPSYYNAIVSYDFGTKQTAHCLELEEILLKINYNPKIGVKNAVYFVNYAILSDTAILIPFLHSNYVLEFDLETYDYKLHKIGSGTGFISINKYGDDFLLIERENPIVNCWNWSTGEIKSYSAFPNGFPKSVNKSFFGTLSVKLIGNYLYGFAGYANMSVKIELPTGKIERIAVLDKYCKNGGKENLVFHSAIVQENRVYLHCVDGNKIIEYDTQTDAVAEYVYKARDFFDDNIVSARSNRFIDSLISDADYETKVCGNISRTGEKIYDYVKKLVIC